MKVGVVQEVLVEMGVAQEVDCGGGRGTRTKLGAGGGGCNKRRDKKHRRRHPKAAIHGGSKQFGRNKKQAACKTEVPVIL